MVCSMDGRWIGEFSSDGCVTAASVGRGWICKSCPTMKPLSLGSSMGSSEMFQSEHNYPGVKFVNGFFSVQVVIYFCSATIISSSKPYPINFFERLPVPHLATIHLQASLPPGMTSTGP